MQEKRPVEFFLPMNAVLPHTKFQVWLTINPTEARPARYSAEESIASIPSVILTAEKQ